MITPKVKIEDRDKEWKRFLRTVESIKRCFVSIGVHEDAGKYTKKGSPPVAQVAFYNEFGTERGYKRSFLRSTIDEKMSVINLLRGTLLDKILAGEISVGQGLETMGFRIREWVVNKIQSNIPPALTGATRRRKIREGKPVRTLIDSGIMLRSIAYKVVK